MNKDLKEQVEETITHFAKMISDKKQAFFDADLVDQAREEGQPHGFEIGSTVYTCDWQMDEIGRNRLIGLIPHVVKDEVYYGSQPYDFIDPGVASIGWYALPQTTPEQAGKAAYHRNRGSSNVSDLVECAKKAIEFKKLEIKALEYILKEASEDKAE